ncbi:MAG TPA: hypothetical protein PKE12_03395 [Kiritimatiellia bacterium]|nr:hypothetical protein [Kiritimatiellia bacterium]
MRSPWMPVPVLSLLSAVLVLSLGCSGSSSDSSDDDSDGGGGGGGASISGKWSGSYSTGVEFTLDLTQSGDSFVGSYATGESTLGTVTGTVSTNAMEMTITTTEAPPVAAQFTGSINDQRTAMGGTFTIVSGGGGNGTWSASK